VKFDSEGEVEWEQKPGGEGLQWLDSAMRTDDGYLFTGGSDAGPVGGVDGYVLATDAAGETRWESYYGTSGWDKPWPAIRAHDGGYLLAGQTSGGGSEGKDGWLVRIGASNESDAAATTSETTASGEAAATSETTATTEETDTDEASDTDETTNEAMRGETVTATAESEGGVPGFGVGAALVALAAVLLVARR
jgi:PGF-CTERM protein